jgi:hypothetical protein
VLLHSYRYSYILLLLLLPQVDRYAAVRQSLGLPVDARGSGPAADVLEYVAGCEGLTPSELAGFVQRCLAKYEAKRVDPGGRGLGREASTRLGVMTVQTSPSW